MVYVMKFQVDGACRGNGTHSPRAAAAAILLSRNEQSYDYKVEVLDSRPKPTNQRAELSAVVLALRWAIQRDADLSIRARVRVIIETDSKYVLGCMTEWISKWRENGWVNAAGHQVANQDLLEDACDLEDQIENDGGVVEYRWIPREQNSDADKQCNQKLDEEVSTQHNNNYDDSDSDWY